jgi:cysteinyl-tRNA synthetase
MKLDLLWEKEETQEIPENIIHLAEERLQAKQEKNYQLADELRSQIQAKWYIIKDIPWWFDIEKSS